MVQVDRTVLSAKYPDSLSGEDNNRTKYRPERLSMVDTIAPHSIEYTGCIREMRLILPSS